MRTKLSQAEFDKSGIKVEGEYNLKKIEEMKAFVKEVNEFYPCEIEYDVSENDGRLYFEHPNAKLKSKIDLYINPKNYQKKYYVGYHKHYKNISSYKVNDIRNSIESPKNIGVLSTKKIQDWVSYNERVHEEIVKVSEKQGSEVEDFLKIIEGMDVQFWNNGKNGEIRKGGLLFRFEISDGYVDKKIVLCIDESASLDVFLKLADNQYNKK